MSASLVGSEMCIRDSPPPFHPRVHLFGGPRADPPGHLMHPQFRPEPIKGGQNQEGTIVQGTVGELGGLGEIGRPRMPQ
eukprot:9266010-Alexandrium_andersonii.AAC.1